MADFAPTAQGECETYEPLPQLNYTSASTPTWDTILATPPSDYVDLNSFITDWGSCVEQGSKTVESEQMSAFGANETEAISLWPGTYSTVENPFLEFIVKVSETMSMRTPMPRESLSASCVAVGDSISKDEQIPETKSRLSPINPSKIIEGTTLGKTKSAAKQKYNRRQEQPARPGEVIGDKIETRLKKNRKAAAKYRTKRKQREDKSEDVLSEKVMEQNLLQEQVLFLQAQVDIMHSLFAEHQTCDDVDAGGG